ncbi:MAG: cell division protein ZapD [Halofilum sp. (in: g-proteobacteria)]|nr:cell division protein ZapD [Halofilum sp. (in: g-proteobacteria)]
MGDIQTFEQPLNERFRLMLRLEQLFERIDAHLSHDDVWQTHAALQAVLELLQTVSRGDSKRELIKELDRQRSALNRFDERPAVDRDRLTALLAEHERLVNALHGGTGALGEELRDNDLLAQLQQRATAGGRPGMLELPSYQEWLQRPASERHDAIRSWLEPMAAARGAIERALAMVRDAGEWNHVTAAGGFYEQPLKQTSPIQLLRLTLDAPGHRFPEISAGRQRFTIRFYHQDSPAARAVQMDDDIEFDLACCGL